MGYIEVWEWMSNFTPHFIMDVINYPSVLDHVSKGSPMDTDESSTLDIFIVGPFVLVIWLFAYDWFEILSEFRTCQTI